MAKTILIIEDDPMNMLLYDDLLQVNGYTTLLARNGQEGINTAQRRHPDLILTDTMLPVINGIEATRDLKAHPETSGIPVIVLASFSLPDEKNLLEECGCNKYLIKPVAIADLLACIKEYCSEPEARTARDGFKSCQGETCKTGR